MPNAYLNSSDKEKLTVSKLRFYKFKKLLPWLISDGLYLKQIPLNFKTCCNLKMRGLVAKSSVAFQLF